jgi:hypothetical protein
MLKALLATIVAVSFSAAFAQEGGAPAPEKKETTKMEKTEKTEKMDAKGHKKNKKKEKKEEKTTTEEAPAK